jgi:membrane protease YdiL (CAAX protease family)
MQKADTLGCRVYFVVFSILIAPVAEEILFRGVLYPAIKQSGFPRSALWGTAVLFAAIHVNLPIFLPLLALGLALALLYEATNNLLAPIAAHGLFNAVNIVVFYLNQDTLRQIHK